MSQRALFGKVHTKIFSKQTITRVLIVMALVSHVAAQMSPSPVRPVAPFAPAYGGAAPAKPFLLASLRPNPRLVWQRVKSVDHPLEGPILYQIIFRSNATPGHIPRIANNFTLTNSLISDNGTQVAIGNLSIDSSGIISFAGSQTFPGTGSVNSVSSGNSFIAIGGTGANPTVSLNTTATDARYLQLGGGTMTGPITFANGQTFPGTGTVTSVNTGAGLTGGPITGAGTISIPNSGVTNAMLQNSSLTVNSGSGLSGGGTVALGGVLTLNNTGVLSVGASGLLASSGGANPSISLTGIVPIANGGTGIVTAPAGAGQFLRSSGAGAWAVGGIQSGDVPNLSGTYVDLNNDQVIGGSKTFSNLINGSISGNAVTASTATVANNALALGGNAAASYGTTAVNDTRYLQLSGGTLAGGLSGTTANFSGNLQTGGALSVPVPNNGGSGTVLNQLAELTGAPSTATNAGTSANVGTIGIVASGAGTAGNAQVAILGAANCVFDGATTAGDYVAKSSTAGGNCHDAGASYPTGAQVIGRVLSTNGGAGTYPVALFPAEERSNAGSVTSVGLSAPADFNVSGSPVTNAGTLALSWGVVPTAARLCLSVILVRSTT